MTKAKCRQCGKPVLPGSEFCSLSCDAGSVMNKKSKRASILADCLFRGMISVTVKAVEFSPKPDIRGPGPKNKPTLWEARISDGQNGDAVARRDDPDVALLDALSCFAGYKKPVTRKPVPEEDDVSDLI